MRGGNSRSFRSKWIVYFLSSHLWTQDFQEINLKGWEATIISLSVFYLTYLIVGNEYVFVVGGSERRKLTFVSCLLCHGLTDTTHILELVLVINPQRLQKWDDWPAITWWTCDRSRGVPPTTPCCLTCPGSVGNIFIQCDVSSFFLSIIPSK